MSGNGKGFPLCSTALCGNNGKLYLPLLLGSRHKKTGGLSPSGFLCEV